MKTRTTLFAFLIMSAFFLPGCIVYNFEPLYEAKDLLVKPDLSGVWGYEEKGRTTFAPQKDGTYSVLDVNEKGEKRKYVGGLVKLNGHYFMDVTAENSRDSDLLFIKARIIFRVSIDDKKITLQSLSDSWLKAQFLKRKLKVDHAIKDDDLILTPSTKNLQKFVSGIANQDAAFSPGSDLVRVK